MPGMVSTSARGCGSGSMVAGAFGPATATNPSKSRLSRADMASVTREAYSDRQALSVLPLRVAAAESAPASSLGMATMPKMAVSTRSSFILRPDGSMACTVVAITGPPARWS